MDILQPNRTGTTIVAMTFEGGVILAADSRTSMGSYVSNRVSNKLTKLTDKIYCCRSGRAAHTQAVAKLVSVYSSNLSVNDEIEPLVSDAARITAKFISENPFLVASMIVAGYDEKDGGSVYSVNIGGTLLKRDWVIGGSGSAFIYGHCDATYRSDMTFEERMKLVRNLVKLAIQRDNSSGGCIRMAVITNDGVESVFIPGNEL